MSEQDVQVGMRAPDFELFEASEERIRLYEELKRRPVLLLFYPSDFGIVCSLEMKTFTEMYTDIQNRGVSVLAVGRNSTYSHRQFKENLGIPFPLLSDLDGSVSNRYAGLLDIGVLDGMSRRAAFIIDRLGIVRYYWVSHYDGLLPPFDEIKERVLTLEL